MLSKKCFTTGLLGLSILFSPLASAMMPWPQQHGYGPGHHGHYQPRPPVYGWFNRPWFHRTPPRVVVIQQRHPHAGVAIIKHRRGGVEVRVGNGRR